MRWQQSGIRVSNFPKAYSVLYVFNYNFAETLRKFIIAKFPIRKLGSVLIMHRWKSCGSKALR